MKNNRISCLLVLFLLGLQFWNRSAIGADLLKAAPDMPVYRLGEIKRGKNAFGQQTVTLDYERTKDGPGFVRLAGRSADGPLKIMGGSPMRDSSGTIQLSDLFSNIGIADVELYLVVSGNFAEECPYECLISNVVRAGTPSGNASVAREWNATEKKAYEKDLLGRQPPKSLPVGYQLVSSSTKLIPGMPVKAGYYGEWKDAEALTDAPIVTVKLTGQGQMRLLNRDGWLALAPEVLKQGQSNPGAFKPSENVIPNTTTIIPQGYVVVSKEMNIVPGVPVMANWHQKLHESTVMRVDNSKLLIHYDGEVSAFDQPLDRSTLLISLETVGKLNLPNAKEDFAKRVPKPTTGEDITNNMIEKNLADAAAADRAFDKSMAESKESFARAEREHEEFRKKMEAKRESQKQGSNGLPLLDQPSPVTLSIPKEAEPVPEGLLIPKGTKLAMCWGPSWSYITVMEDSVEAKIPASWDLNGFERMFFRSQLIIRKTDLKKIKEASAKNLVRTWKDATGKFAIEATFVSKTSSEITLKKADGKTVTLDLKKLSAEDRTWIRENL